jgi:hypothetical protein
MTVELTPQEMELVLLALKQRMRQVQGGGTQAVEEADLIARLEVVERQQRGERPHVQ